MRRFLPLAVVTFAVACAGGAPHQRGWIGGTFEPVRRGGGAFEPDGPAYGSDGLVGLPDGVESDTALLLVDVAPGTPLHRAGLRAGDLVLAVDDEPATSSLALRRRIEQGTPGDRVRLTYRRGRTASNRSAEVVLGRETYERRLTVGLGLFVAPKLDLWPFDDGIDLLGLVAIGGSAARREPRSAEATYFARTLGTNDADEPQQETFVVRVIPFSFGVGNRVLERSAEPAPGK